MRLTAVLLFAALTGTPLVPAAAEQADFTRFQEEGRWVIRGWVGRDHYECLANIQGSPARLGFMTLSQGGGAPVDFLYVWRTGPRGPLTGTVTIDGGSTFSLSGWQNDWAARIGPSPEDMPAFRRELAAARAVTVQVGGEEVRTELPHLRRALQTREWCMLDMRRLSQVGR